MEWLDETIATNQMLRTKTTMSLVDPEILDFIESRRDRLPVEWKLTSLYHLLQLCLEDIHVVYPSKPMAAPDSLYHQY